MDSSVSACGSFGRHSLPGTLNGRSDDCTGQTGTCCDNLGRDGSNAAHSNYLSDGVYHGPSG